MLVEHFDIFKSYLKQAELVFSDIYITGDINCCNLFNPGDSHIKRLINILDVYHVYGEQLEESVCNCWC